MLALSIRQPFAELILRGVKTIEYRSRATRIIGQRFWIYASKRPMEVGQDTGTIWSRDLSAGEDPPAWMIEIAQQIKLIEPGTVLPTGMIVGSAVIERCTPLTTRNDQPSILYEWHLGQVERIEKLRKPERKPQPVWFKPF